MLLHHEDAMSGYQIHEFTNINEHLTISVSTKIGTNGIV